MKSQVTTKLGDDGQTMALSGVRYSKAHAIMDCVGTLDELRAHTATLRLTVLDSGRADAQEAAHFLLWLMHVYFPIGSALSDPENARPEYHKVALTPGHLERLEREQARLEEQTPLPPIFVVCATNAAAAQADVTCTVARRLERAVVHLAEQHSAFEAKNVLAFLNRLSDYLFILARYLEDGQHTALDYTRLCE